MTLKRQLPTLTEAEMMTVIQGFLRSCAPQSATRDEIDAMIAEVHRMRMEGALADLLCDGRVEVADWRDGELSMCVVEAEAER